MNHRVSPPATAKGRRAWLFLSLLLPALAGRVSTPSASLASPVEDGSIPTDRSEPYLRFVGPPPLRFQDALPPPDLSARPPAGSPPKLESREHREMAFDAAETTKSGPAVAASTPPAPAPKPVAAAEPAPPPSPAAGAVAPILPDDVPSRVKPEDFLPFFQYPGSGSGAANPPAPPAPGTLPPSTATYKQQ